MNEDDRRLIEEYAEGNHALKDAAAEAYRRACFAGDTSGLHQDFMAAIEARHPDYALRAHHRRALLEHVRASSDDQA